MRGELFTRRSRRLFLTPDGSFPIYLRPTDRPLSFRFGLLRTCEHDDVCYQVADPRELFLGDVLRVGGAGSKESLTVSVTLLVAALTMDRF